MKYGNTDRLKEPIFAFKTVPNAAAYGQNQDKR